jgi:hypothetical protein
LVGLGAETKRCPSGKLTTYNLLLFEADSGGVGVCSPKIKYKSEENSTWVFWICALKRQFSRLKYSDLILSKAKKKSQ